MAIVKVRGTLKDGLFTPKSKRPRVDDFGNFPNGRGSYRVMVQSSESEDHNSLLDRDLVKSSKNLQQGKRNDGISHFSITATPPEILLLPQSVLKSNSVKSKEDRNTNLSIPQGLRKRQPLSDEYRPERTAVCGNFDFSHQHVHNLEDKDNTEVKKDLDVIEATLAKSKKQNWSNEYQHKVNTVSKNVVTTFNSKNSHFVLGRKRQPLWDHQQPYQTSMHAEFTSQKSVEVENKNRNKVKGALEAYREILTKSEAQNCNWSYIKAAMDLKKQGKWVNKMKQVGSIAGVKVGDRFRHRAQLTIVGLHRQFTCGIDYMWRNDGKILATSIVDSGRYVNNLQSSDILIYSGQGGKSLFHKTKQTYQTKPTDQIMQGGNLALRNSKEEGTPIRVIRRLKHSKGSCYVYYGLYTVERVLQERQLGIMIYKFMLRRKSGQPELSFDSS